MFINRLIVTEYLRLVRIAAAYYQIIFVSFGPERSWLSRMYQSDRLTE
jgi:hypothetical protein